MQMQIRMQIEVAEEQIRRKIGVVKWLRVFLALLHHAALPPLAATMPP